MRSAFRTFSPKLPGAFLNAVAPLLNSASLKLKLKPPGMPSLQLLPTSQLPSELLIQYVVGSAASARAKSATTDNVVRKAHAVRERCRSILITASLRCRVEELVTHLVSPARRLRDSERGGARQAD